ncbi:MAG TPA: amino acid adenylation domain-containing protein, partial [Herpetosiphonaceae bacterium]
GPQVQVVNIYGLTEISDINILGVLRADDLGKPVTVGTPLQNNRIYILDQHQQPQPIGLAGEICIAGESVSRGYLFRPDLTAERFVPCPFEDGALMVRTGDLGRWLPNGTVEILGRIDHQVKIRGFRIETGEIEAVLAQHPGIDECAVVAREDGAGDQRLVAYMVEQGDKGTREPKNKGTGHAELETWNLKLHAYLARHLPAYMIPAAFVVLDALPKTPSGKLDRNALPAPGEDRPTVGDSLVAPRTPIEEIIAEVWAAVLKVRPIGVHDNFFTLGGHSLLATQAITRLRQIFDRDIPLRLLFEAPTIAELAPRLAQEQIADALPLRRVPRDGTRLPLSSAQQRLWFLDQVQPSSTLYSIPLVLRLSGSLDHAALERSLNVIVERHEVLRTTFAYDPDAMLEPYQQIRPPGHVPLPLVALPATADEEYIRQAVLRVVRQPFDFQNGPLLRGTIFQRHPTEHILAFVIHHSIFDGWSQSVLLRELTSLYRGFVEGVEVVLPPLPVQYGDYAMWQRQWLAGCPQGIAPGDILGRQLGYWQQQLANCPPLDLPLDHPRPTAPSDRGDVVAVPLGAALSTRLRHLSQRLGSTLYMTLLAAWQTLLYRYSGQTDIAVGTPIAGRLRPELEGLIGCFVNTLVLRSSLAGNPRFAEVVARVRATALEAYAHQDLPFEVVVEHIQPERDLGRTPLFQVMFTLQNTPRAAIELPDLTLEPLMLGPHTAKFDLSLSLSETPDGLRGAIEYRTDLFEARTIARMAAHYQILLSAITSDPDQPIDRLPLLAEAERQRLLARRPRGAPTPVCVHHLIAAQTARTPDALAVQYQDRTLTYRQLDQRANQIAHHLQSLGVRPDVRVGVCLDRAPELIVALLGILKAGGAYVPLDPTYPQERLFFMAQDAGIAVLITDQALRSSLPCYEGPILWLDRDAALIDRQPLALPDTSVAPDHLMYVIYTSGSTGQPKGVLITHRAVVSYLAGVRHRYTVLPNDRVLLFASIGFDASVEELFVTLTTGATVVLRTDEMLASPQAFMEHCRQWQITVLSLPTAFWHVLADASATGTLDVPPSVRMVIIGGEQAARDHVRRWQEQLGDRIALVNVYGPTETTVAATAYVVPSALPADRVDIPIGLPLAHARAYILDRQIQLVPPGLPGELYIGGESLARGYLNRPDLTAERFIPDPFSDEHAQDAGARLYKTGDLVRYGRDGMLVFLGRVDSQVKLRGFRIELSEIEVTLRQHPGVHEAVVLLREDHPGEQQLVAYVVEQRATEHSEDHASPAPAHAEREPGGEGLTSELREFLGSRLPAYMVPSAFVLLDALPRTPTDKIDRRALPAPTAAPIERQPALATPHDQWELWLSQLWADLLHRPVVGVTENFFALGGHSLLAVRLMAHVQQRIGRALPLAALIQAPTIRQLAAYLRRESPAEPWTPIVPLRPHGDRPPLFLIHPIGGTVFCYTALVCHLDARRQVYGLQARGVDAGQTPHTSIRAMAAEYVAAIRTIQPHGPYLLGGWSMGGVVAFEVAQQFRQHGQQVDLLALIDSGPPSASRSMPDDATLVAAFARDLAAVYGKRLVISREELADLPVEQRLSYVLMQARRQASVPPDITEEQISQLAATFRAHLVALHTYAPAAPAERAALLEARPADAPQPSRAERWRAWSHHLEVVQHSADHYGLMHPPHVQAVAAWLEHQLMQAIRPA